LAYDIFKPELWSAELNYSLKKALVADSLVNRNWQGQIRQMGDTVHINEPGSVTSNAYTAYSDITFEQPSGTDRQLVITEANYTAVDVDDIDQAQANVALMQAHAQESAYSLSNSQDAFVFKSFGAAQSGVASDHSNTVTLSRTNIYPRFVDAAFVLDKLNVRSQGRWAAVSPAEMALMRQAAEFVPNVDSAATPLWAGGGTSASAGVVATGQIGSMAGFQVFVTNNLTTNSGVKKILFGTTQAITFASQVAKTEATRREARFADAVKSLVVYGKKEVRPDALAVLHA